MTVETASWINEFDPSLPAQSDLKREGPQHMRMTKTVLQNTFPNFGTAAPVNATPAELNYSVGVTSGIQAQLDTLTSAKAAKAGDSYTGTHDFTGATIRGATMPIGTATTELATTAFVAATGLSSALPGQVGNALKFVKTDGATPSWAFPELEAELISTNTTAVPGKHYIFTANCTLTLPTSWTTGDPIAFTNASGLESPAIDFGATKLGGSTPGVMTLNSTEAFGKIIYSGDAATGLVKA
jgi:hypothetical protein